MNLSGLTVGRGPPHTRRTSGIFRRISLARVMALSTMVSMT